MKNISITFLLNAILRVVPALARGDTDHSVPLESTAGYMLNLKKNHQWHHIKWT